MFMYVCECEYEHVSVLIQSMNYLSQSINQSVSDDHISQSGLTTTTAVMSTQQHTGIVQCCPVVVV